MSTLADKIDFLFETFTKEDGEEYTYQEVEEGTGRAVTGAYVWQLRTGKKSNPGYRVLQALSKFFDVPVGFFFGEVGREHVENLKLATELRRKGVARIALRASDLNEAAKRDILSMIEYVRKASGLHNGEADEEGEAEEGKGKPK